MKPAGEAGLPFWKAPPRGSVPRAAHPRTQSPLRVPSSRRRLVRALPHGFSSVAASLLPHVARWLCSPGGWASPVRRVPGERMSSLLWLLQRAEACLQLASLQRGKPRSEQDTACPELSWHREQGGGKAGREEEIFDGVFQQLFPLFLFYSLKARPTVGVLIAREQYLCHANVLFALATTGGITPLVTISSNFLKCLGFKP